MLSTVIAMPALSESEHDDRFKEAPDTPIGNVARIVLAPPDVTIGLVTKACQTINLATSCRSDKLSDQGIGELQVFEGLMDGLDRVLGLSPLLLEAFLGFEPTAWSGFGLFGGVSFHWGYGESLRTFGLSCGVRRNPYPM
jgi:hypothetical protein